MCWEQGSVMRGFSFGEQTLARRLNAALIVGGGLLLILTSR